MVHLRLLSQIDVYLRVRTRKYINSLALYGTTCSSLWSCTLHLCPPKNGDSISWRLALLP